MEFPRRFLSNNNGSMRNAAIFLILAALIMIIMLTSQLNGLQGGSSSFFGTTQSKNECDYDRGCEQKQRVVDSALLASQMDAQRRFQQLLHYRQFSTIATENNGPRVLLVKPSDRVLDGFALEIQMMARYLQVAVSTERRLVISPDWRSAYDPPDCSQGGWTCLWEPVSNTTTVATTTATTSQQTRDATTVFRGTKNTSSSSSSERLSSSSTSDSLLTTPDAGILPGRPNSTYFNVGFYGSDLVVEAPSWRWDWRQNIDVVPHWERSHGRFWIRAQMAHFLWRPRRELRLEIERRAPPELLRAVAGQERQSHDREAYIAFHIRYTDNIRDLEKDFARDAAATRDFARFMAFAESIRDRHYPDKSLRTIFLATDSSYMVDQSRDERWKRNGWKFVLQNRVQRSDSKQYMWFRSGRSGAAGAIATDLEVMRRADFLVGSFQSNVYRLAAELNTAWNVDRYPVHMHRHFTVDVEWYEDP